MSEQHPACFLYGPGDARFEPSPRPIIEDPLDVIVQIAYTGVCGSDVHFWVNGGVTAEYTVKTPLIMGHEASGTVVAVGKNVTTLAPGDNVAMEPGMKFAASPPNTHGTLTKFYKLPEDFFYKLPQTLSLREGVLVEPTSVAVHAVKLAHVKPGYTVVIFGAGTVGLLCIAVSKAFGAVKVVAVDIAEKRLSFASKYGASGIYKPDQTLDDNGNAAKLMQSNALEVDDVDVVIDASGAEASIRTGMIVLKKGGTYVQTGLGKEDITFPIMTLSTKELRVYGCFRYGSGDYELALKLIEEGKVSIKELITDVLPFKEATSAWEMVRRGEGIKVLIEGVT